ncbi:hypothetical protein CIPAW_01G106100 [Carya illinoinensis]|uniref:PORR domain-containing protein n=1 Tax=Carya illinoinensis TaxID=32201 RepID=A0A8T1RL12_CARIL|nr:hypothetical protein CIPAW_01G106100 [Carya illinoinensis]
MCQKNSSMWVPVNHKSSGGRRPKKKIYHRVHELDMRVMDLQKKPPLILRLKSIIQSQKQYHSLVLRDLEKQVGFVQKWNFMTVIEKYLSIFCADGGITTPPSVRLTGKARKIANDEAEAKNLIEPILLLIDCRVLLEKIEFIESELGLQCDFKKSLIPKYPDIFSVKEGNGKGYLKLENWDSLLAVIAREERLAREGIMNFAGAQKKLEKWQKMEIPSPYVNARRFEAKFPKAQKRVVAILHEFLSLTIEKRMTSAQLDAFYYEYLLPSQLLLCLIKHHGMFYITNKSARSTVFLKEAYDGSNLIDKCPFLFYNKFVSLSGRKETDLHGGMPSS